MISPVNWLALTEASGLFVSEPVLRETFPQGLPPLSEYNLRRLRGEYDRFLTTDSDKRRWQMFILRDLLGLGERVQGRLAMPPNLRIELPDYNQTLQPDFFVMSSDSVPQILIILSDGRIDKPEQTTGRWRAAPATKLERLLRDTRVPLGLVTDGESWRLIYAAPGLTTAQLTWSAALWRDETATLAAFATLAGDPARLLKMAEESQQRQADVTDELGAQVLGALAQFVRALDDADLRQNGALLRDLSPAAIYEMALFTMMRLVFMLYAEENRLLPHGERIYDDAYGLTSLWNRLDRQHIHDDAFDRRTDAWLGLVASFRLIYEGSAHPDLVMVAYGGKLFDRARFPLLEHPDLLISNQALWEILRQLTTAEGRDGRQRVSYRLLQVEQLGTVYEFLLGYTVQTADVPMMIPVAGLEAQPVALFADALAGGTLPAALKPWTRLRTHRLKGLAADAEARREANPDADAALWLEPAAETFIQPGQRHVAFQMGTRKRGGVYYTRPQLTSFMVERALRPLCYDEPDSGTPRIKSAQDILALTVCDPAMGSGAFLVQAVRYLGERVLEAWEAAQSAAPEAVLVMPYAQDEHKAEQNYGPIPADRADAMGWASRFVAERCIYGVDLNALASELAKLSVWLVTLSKDKPFTFLDHALKHGNSLIGASFRAEFDLEVKQGRGIAEGRIPMIHVVHDSALKAFPGDKAEMKAARDSNKKGQFAAAGRQRSIFGDIDFEAQLFALNLQELQLESPTLSADDYARKEAWMTFIRDRSSYPRLKRIADLWTATWFWPRDIAHYGLPPTTAEYQAAVSYILTDYLGDPSPRTAQLLDAAQTAAAEHSFFHWEIEFPDAFARKDPGFDAVVGNPPWETVKPNSIEFFEAFDPDIRSYKDDVVRDFIAALRDQPPIDAAWRAYERRIIQSSDFFSAELVYTRQGRGDLNTYKLFLERALTVTRSVGIIGLILQAGVYSGLGTMELRNHLFETTKIQYLFGLSNERKIFVGVNNQLKFALIGIQKGVTSDTFQVAFRLHPTEAIRAEDLPTFMSDPANLVMMPVEAIHRFSPDSLSVMEFRSQRDADVTAKLYAAGPLLGEDLPGVWQVHFTTEFHMTNYKHLFNRDGCGLPLYEGKMIHQFDAHYAEPQYWVEEEQGRIAAGEDYQRYRLGFRDIASSTNERSFIASILPMNTFAGNTVVLSAGNSNLGDIQNLYLASIVNSFCIDNVIRRKITNHLNIFYVEQLPVPRLMVGHPVCDALVERAARLTCTDPAFAALWASVMGAPWPNDPLICPPPRHPDPAVAALRQSLRDEIDALVAHLYGLSRDDYEHILGGFPLVFPPTPDGASRKAAVLAAYDAATT